MELYVFNPDTDLALACQEENYMAPASIRSMAKDLAVLPVWYAPSGSAVLAPSAYNLDYVRQMQALFPLSVRLFTEPELSEHPEVQLRPWGWNPAFRKRMLKGGVSLHLLPSVDELSVYREQAGRHAALRVLKVFEGQEHCCGTGVVLSTLADCEAYLREQSICLFKTPWSGSGKGLLWCRKGFHSAIAGWCGKVLAEQGFLVGMPIYNKVLDFAMEFHADGSGKVGFAGYSLFSTNAKGAYVGNRLESDTYIEEQIAGYVPLTVLRTIRCQLEEVLPEVCMNYVGFLGVDMMLCRLYERGNYAIFPCVEINMRMNMGVVSRLFFDRFVHPASHGTFCVEAFATADELWEAHRRDELNFPLIVQNGKFLSGYLPLTPVTTISRYRAYAKVCEGGENPNVMIEQELRAKI